MKEKGKNLWCLAYGIYACFGDWLVDQVDHNDYLAGFLCAFLIYALLVMGNVSMNLMTIVWNK